MEKWRPWETASDADWETAVEREALIRTLAEDERLTKERLQEAMLALGLCRSLLYKLLHRYRQRPQTSSLLPWKRGRCADVRLLAPEREELLQSCIREFYLALHGRFHAGSQTAFLRTADSCAALSNRTAPNRGPRSAARHEKKGRTQEGARTVRPGRYFHAECRFADGYRPNRSHGGRRDGGGSRVQAVDRTTLANTGR